MKNSMSRSHYVAQFVNGSWKPVTAAYPVPRCDGALARFRRESPSGTFALFPEAKALATARPSDQVRTEGGVILGRTALMTAAARNVFAACVHG